MDVALSTDTGPSTARQCLNTETTGGSQAFVGERCCSLDNVALSKSLGCIAFQQKHFTDKDSKQTGKRWTTEIIKKLIQVAWDMWDHRNDILHNDGGNFHKKMEGAEADVMIRTEFNMGKDTLLREDKFLLRSFRTTMKSDLQEKKKWLQDVAGARAAWVAKQNEPPSFDVERRPCTNG